MVHLKSWRSFRTPFDVDSWIFSKFARLGDKILDTHLGSGSSRIAAYEAELDFVGFEIDMEYFQEQEKRFDTHISQLSIFAGGGTLDLCY